MEKIKPIVYRNIMIAYGVMMDLHTNRKGLCGELYDAIGNRDEWKQLIRIENQLAQQEAVNKAQNRIHEKYLELAGFYLKSAFSTYYASQKKNVVYSEETMQTFLNEIGVSIRMLYYKPSQIKMFYYIENSLRVKDQTETHISISHDDIKSMCDIEKYNEILKAYSELMILGYSDDKYHTCHPKWYVVAA